MATATIICLFSALFISFFIKTLQVDPSADYYTAAVVEYSGTHNSGLTPLQNVISNAEKHVDIIKKATENNTIDIIVFPELGLLNYDHSIFIEVPDPVNKIIPAKNDSCHEVLQKISAAAASSKVYVVVNLHESYKKDTKEYRYNTNVVFDRNGAIIARYRKYNLFGERYLNRPTTPEYVNFTTDFGVTFGTFICFDIVFEEPAIGLVRDHNITDIVYPTAWFSELPFHIGIQEQSSWAYATDVNLLASGYNNMSTGNTGSGIYAGKNGPVIYLQSVSDGSRILIGKVPKKLPGGKSGTLEKGKIIEYEKVEPKIPPILHEDLNVFTTKLIQPENMTAKVITQIDVDKTKNILGLQKEFTLNEKLCSDEFCCNFDLSFTATYYQSSYSFIDDSTYNKSDAFYHYRYRLIAFDGIRNYYVGNTSGQQLCAIMPCLNDTLESCALLSNGVQPSVHVKDKSLGPMILYSTDFIKINISGDFHNNRVLFLPSVLISSSDMNNNTFGKVLEPSQFQFDVKKNSETSHISLVISPNKFASGGILARLFERDNKPNSANIPVGYSVIWCLVPLIVYFYCSR